MNICRVCAESKEEALVPIFTRIEDVYIANIITDCASIQILEGDGLPASICSLCIEGVKSTSAFVKKCRESDKKLRKMFKTEEEDTPVTFPMVMLDILPSNISKFEPEIEIEEPIVKKENSSESESEESEEYVESESDSEPTSRRSRKRKAAPKKKINYRELQNSDSEKEQKEKIDGRSLRRLLKDDTEGVHESMKPIPVKGFICCGCLKMYENKLELQKHCKQVHEVAKRYTNKEHSCDICFKKFSAARGLKEHKTFFKRVKHIFGCTKCEKVFKERRLANWHAIKHPGTRAKPDLHYEKEQIYGKLCCAAACTLSFKTEEELLEHAQIKHIINKAVKEDEVAHLPVECRYCYKRFESEEHVLKHQRRKYKPSKFQCTMCGERFTNKSSLAVHEQKHKGERTFACELCPKKFFMADILKSHMKIHDSVKQYVCEECGWGFHSKPNLKIHMVTHSDEKLYQCTFCPKSFKVKVSLQFHLRTHTGEKPHKCKFCEKTFANPGNMRHHQNSHSGYKPHQCSQCDRRFVRKKQLQEHEAKHQQLM